jgi:predicted enzyme related to lactoylglutathione lyase
MKLWFNLFCRDIDAQFNFYRELLKLPEAAASHSPIYRALETPDFQFGFNAWAAYALLGMDERAPKATDAPPPVIAYTTLMVADPTEVDDAAKRVSELGGRVVKGPYPTYYGQWQVVLADPEANIFRLSAAALPENVVPPARPVA